MEHINLSNYNEWAKKHIFDDNKFDDNGFIIMENDTNYKSTGIIANILEDHFDSYYFDNYKDTLDRLRPNAYDEVQKIIDCHNHNLGATVYVCEDCDEVIYSHHTCKGRLCSSCGIKTQKKVTENILQTCINSKHRHITFTIPKDLTMWFFKDLYSTNLLFEAVSDTIYSVINGKVKKGKISKYSLRYKPAFFSFLHTFGRPLNFNPHIHVIIAEYVMDKSGNIKKYDYFNYDALSKRFMKILLDKMSKYFGKKEFYDTKNNMYLKYPNGFYVNNRLEDDGITFNSLEELIKYVTRYCARPAMAESRIINYDGENVTFFYVDHKTKEYTEVTVSAFKFIGMLLRHLLPSNFKSIRSYGFYNKKSKISDKIKLLVSKEKRKIRKDFLKWSNLIILSFKRIPISCPKCGKIMEPIFEVS